MMESENAGTGSFPGVDIDLVSVPVDAVVFGRFFRPFSFTSVARTGATFPGDDGEQGHWSAGLLLRQWHLGAGVGAMGDGFGALVFFFFCFCLWQTCYIYIVLVANIILSSVLG